MIKIVHHVNTLDQFNGLDPTYGVEMDVHAFGKRLVVQHDALQEGPELSDWLTVCGKRFVIFNIKEEGVETKVIELAKKSGVTDYFLLDLSFPALIRQVRKGESRVAVRVSKYELLECALLLESKIEWVWLDCFEGFPLSRVEFQRLQNSRLKVCLVSPELHGPPRGKNDIVSFQNTMQSYDAKVDAVCTKFPELW